MKEEKKGKGVSRRDFFKIAGAGSIAAGSLGPAFLFPERAAAQQKTISIKDPSTGSGLGGVPAGWRILDIGPETVNVFGAALKGAALVVWNGPMGVFENPKFAQGTFAIARAVAQSGAFSIVGGGDSAAAVMQSGVESKITHISTGGGASLEFLSGQKLPGVEVLTDKET